MRKISFITGPTGCEKPTSPKHRLQACSMGYPVVKIRYPLLFEEIHAGKGTGMYLRYLKKLSRTKILILDDSSCSPSNRRYGAAAGCHRRKEQTAQSS